jgi:large subunit ribosomal protein L25
MVNELILMAEPRTIHGKKVKRLRREGLVPGVIYGPVVDETVSVSVNSRDFNKFFTAHGHSTIFTLTWDGGTQPVLIREVQRDPVRQDILHIDFFAPNMNVTLRQSVPVTLHNQGEVEEGGVLQTALTEIEVEALPANLPHEIVVDVSGLTAIGNSLHVADITPPENVEIVTDPETTVASVIHLVVEAEPEVEAEAEEGAEAAAGEGEESSEGGEEASSDEE